MKPKMAPLMQKTMKLFLIMFVHGTIYIHCPRHCTPPLVPALYTLHMNTKLPDPLPDSLFGNQELRTLDIADSEVALRVSHSSLMSSNRMKPGSGDWAFLLTLFGVLSVVVGKEKYPTCTSLGTSLPVDVGAGEAVPQTIQALGDYQVLHLVCRT
uniref:(California timema) hypothetical protein n=1 Tax=Timema californicum TaxID=61474 RepID=A0A7R9JD20_TIMCA|nr:unnamed protein product [Timema californicum]